MGVEAYLAALLFFKSAAMKKSAVQEALQVDEASLAAAVLALRNKLEGSGLALIETASDLQLATAPELGEFVEGLRREELRKDIGKAGAETLAIILYRGPVLRAEIDAIRGVNSATILRNLMVRGLIERSPTRTGGGYQFTVTPQLLAHLGVSDQRQLPDYAAVLNELEAFEKAQVEEGTEK